MDAASTAAILKIVAQYGVLGLGWVAWILTMFYLQLERKRYAALVTHIIQYFTKVNLSDVDKPTRFLADDDADEDAEGLSKASTRHKKTFRKLFP